MTGNASHLILVIDDQIGKPDSPERTAFLRAVGYFPSTGGKERVTGHPYEFEFHTGQTESGDNSIEAVKAAVLKHWPASDGKRWALVLLDVRFGDGEQFGFTLLRALRDDSRFGEDLPIVMLTSEGKGKKAEAGKLNATGFFPKSDESGKPLWSEEGLREKVMKFGLIPDDREESALIVTKSARLFGRSLPFLKVLRAARSYALNPQGGCILYGESGSGKSELAAYIHTYAQRTGPYVRWFADPASKDTAKGELFGWWKGAFTGADHHQPGRIERSHRGTFFLDEIANLPMEVQKAVLQIRDADENGFRRLTRMGNFPPREKEKERKAAMESIAVNQGVKLLPDYTLQVDVLLLTGTNRDLEDPTVRKENQFLSDLLWDLGTPLRFPSLNDRQEDVVDLFKLFAQRVASRSGDSSHELPIQDEVLDLLRGRDWSRRGNVRDLKRIAESAGQRFGEFGQIRLQDLPPDVLKDAEADRARSKAALPEQCPPESPIVSATPVANRDGQMDSAPGALTRAELEHLRHRAQLLENAAEATRKEDAATGKKTKYQPTVAVSRLMGNPVTGVDAKRIINTNILGPIFSPTKKMENAYGKAGIESIQAWARSRPVLVALYRYATDEISADQINADEN